MQTAAGVDGASPPLPIDGDLAKAGLAVGGEEIIEGRLRFGAGSSRASSRGP